MAQPAYAPHAPPREKCEVCTSPMKYLGCLPRSLREPARWVFRCYECNNVAQKIIDDLPKRSARIFTGPGSASAILDVR